MTSASEGFWPSWSNYEYPYQYPDQHFNSNQPQELFYPPPSYSHRRPSNTPYQGTEPRDLSYSDRDTRRRLSTIPPQSLGVFDFSTPVLMSTPESFHLHTAGVPEALLPSNSPYGENVSSTMGQSESETEKDGSRLSTSSSSQTKNTSNSQNSTASNSQTGTESNTWTRALSYSEASIMSLNASGNPPAKKKRGRPLGSKNKPPTTISPSLGTRTRRAATASAAASRTSIVKVKPPRKKRSPPAKSQKGPLTTAISSSNASNALPKKQGRPPLDKHQSPSKSAATVSKRLKQPIRNQQRIKKPTKAELAHLEVNSYRVDPDDGKLFWLLPDGEEPKYLPHPGHGQKYQWGFDYANLPENYKSDDGDAGKQLWLKAKQENCIGYQQESHPLGEDEDAEGESDDLDAALVLTAMHTEHDPEGPSPPFNHHDGSPAASRASVHDDTLHIAGGTTNDQSAAEDHAILDPIEEIPRPQPVADGTRESATTPGLPRLQDGPAPPGQVSTLSEDEDRHDTRWHHRIKKVDVWETRVGLLPPPRGVARKMVVLATG